MPTDSVYRPWCQCCFAGTKIIVLSMHATMQDARDSIQKDTDLIAEFDGEEAATQFKKSQTIAYWPDKDDPTSAYYAAVCDADSLVQKRLPCENPQNLIEQKS